MEIETCKQKLSEFSDFLKTLSDSLSSRTNNDFEISFYETNYKDNKIDVLYRPNIIRKKKKKCSNCDGQGLLCVDNVKKIYKLCSCQISFTEYVSEEIDVLGKCDDLKELYVLSNNKILTIPQKFIKSCFLDTDLLDNIDFLFYTKKEDCEKFCEIMNGGYSNDTK